MFVRLSRLWAIAEEMLAVGLLIAITAIVLLQVVGRYILTNPFIWTEEVTRLLLIYLTFIAAAAVTRRGIHIAVDMFLRPMPSRMRVLAVGLGECVTAASFIWMAWLGGMLAMQLGTLPLAATRWPMAVMVWPAAAACGLIALYAGLRGWVRLWSVARNRDVTVYINEFEESVRS